MKATRTAAIILAISLTLFVSLNVTGTAAAQTGCGIQLLTSNTVQGNWASDCLSQNRENSYARFYSLRLAEPAQVTITLESETDPYLFLHTEQGEFIAENDDIDLDARNYNSRIVATLEFGNYTIEATTYHKRVTGDFTLTIEGIDLTAPDDSDRAALTALYHATDGDNWHRNDNWLTNAPLDEWYGVDTDDEGRVTELDLQGNRLSGHIPPETGNLVGLTDLILQGNRLTGTVPTELGNLTHLETLGLSDNRLWGELPRSMTALTQLRLLSSLFNNGLCAPDDVEFQEWLQTIPSGFAQFLTCNPPSTTPHAGDLSVLPTLYNAMGGDNWDDNTNWLSEQPLQYWKGVTINSEGRVTGLGLQNNQLSGNIPVELGNLSALEFLKLEYNQLTGTIPTELGNLVSLRTLDIQNNQLSGSIPAELGNLVNLKSLYLDHNQLSGDIPAELGNLVNLEYLYLSDNQLSGCIPNALRSVRYNDLRHLGLPFCEDDQPTPDPTPTLPDCVERLPDDMTVSGAWDTECTSAIAAPRGSGDRYARFYTFTLDAESDVTITLDSETDTYLYLRSGTSTDGSTLHENDDHANLLDSDSCAQASGLDRFDSCITTSALNAGDYTVEVTTYSAGDTGSFTLGVTVTPVPETTMPEPPPDPTPSPDPIPAECIESLDSPVSGNWTSECVSLNRTELGVHYARYYTFTLDRRATIDLTLESRTDPYLILLDEAGEIIREDDDDEEAVFDLISRNSGIRMTLDAGEYTVEATTYAGMKPGEFTLTFGKPELDALQALYDDAGGADWHSSDNWLTGAPLSDWHGIKTDDEGRVTEIYLIGNNLDGEIPAELGNLSRLQGLYLARNQLSGYIPSELGNLYNLEVLMLFNNELTGAIPYQLGSLDSLEVMHLSNNRLSGRIPTALGNLENLRRLHLTVNDLDGNIPTSLGDLSNLRQLSIAYNDLTGSIPAEIADLSELTHIYLWGNDLSAGAFVGNLDKLTNLRWLDIGGNRINGRDVLAELDALTELTGLGIHDSGVTDSDMQDNMSALQALDLEFLNISGNDLDDLQTLVQISRITTIQRLAINGNDFSGELPRAMTNLTLMRLFYFHDNDGLCAPDDSEFQDWLRGSPEVREFLRGGYPDVNGPTCTSGTTPANAPAPNSADQFAAALPTPEQLVPPHGRRASLDRRPPDG